MNKVINYTRINEYIYEYLSDVMEQEEIIKSDFMDEDKYEEFLFKSGNDWENGYDFVDWLMSEKNILCDTLMCIYTLTDMYKKVNSWYIDNYGDECLIDWKKLTPEFLLRHYVYYFVHNDEETIKNNLIQLI
jgi:hypothetical protein